jgi:hypothetical protein
MARSDEGPAERGAISTPHSLEDPHPTRLRRATFSHKWEKGRGPIPTPILRLLHFRAASASRRFAAEG